MPFATNIGSVWAGYNVYSILPDSTLNPEPVGIVACNGDVVIPDDPSGTGIVQCVIGSNFADDDAFWNIDGTHTMTTPCAWFIENPGGFGWFGQGIAVGAQANGFLWIQPDGSLAAPAPAGQPAFWPSINWTPILPIPDLSALVCAGDPCDPNVLMEAARCFTGIPNKMRQGIEIYLLCQWLARLNP